MGDWWIDDAPYPGPASSPTLEESFKAAGGVIAHWARAYGKLFAGANLFNWINESARDTPTLKRPPTIRPPKKIAPPVTHVGPRPTHNFAHRGRLKI